MGADKAGLLLEGVPMAARVYDRVAGLAGHAVLVGGGPGLAHRGVETVPDRYPGANALGGIATALGYAAERWGSASWVLCAACDMPLVDPLLVRCLLRVRQGFEVVVPRVGGHHEPLCALYRASCLQAVEEELARGNLCILDVYPKVRTREVDEAELRRVDPDLRSFLNVNRPEDLAAAAALIRGAA